MSHEVILDRKNSREHPWRYPRDVVPSRWTLASWRRAAGRLARRLGFRRACGLCKRPMAQFGWLQIKHPRSLGKTRHRRICTPCAEILIQLMDVLEWYGACDHLPPDVWRPEPTPEEAAHMQQDLDVFGPDD